MPRVFPILSEIELTSVTQVHPKVLAFEAVSNFGLPVSGRVEDYIGSANIVFEIIIQGGSKVVITPITDARRAYRDQYIPRVYLGVDSFADGYRPKE